MAYEYPALCLAFMSRAAYHHVYVTTNISFGYAAASIRYKIRRFSSLVLFKTFQLGDQTCVGLPRQI